MVSSYDGVVEVRELNANEASQLLKEDNWKLLEIKTFPCRVFRERIATKSSITTTEWTAVYDEYEKIVYVLGRVES